MPKPKINYACPGWALILPALALGMATLLPAPVKSQNQAVSSWLKPETPVLKTVKAAVPAESLPPYSYKDCSPKTKFVTIPKNILKAQAEASFEVCAIQTAYGQHSATDGNIRLNDTGIAGPVQTVEGINRLFGAIPNSNHAMYAEGGFYGAHRFIIKDFADNIETVPQPNGSLFHRLKRGVVGEGIKNARGALIDFKDPRFSDNGKWMVGEVPQTGMTRVNIETGETLVFGSGYNHGVGIYPNFVSAISGDGRYALVSEFGYEVFKIYDLSTCVPNPDPTKQATCQFRDLFSFAKAKIPAYRGVWHAQFSTNYSLRLYIGFADANQLKHGYFSLTAPGETESQLDYLATGDSFASGEGTFNYKPGTDVRDPHNKCHLSLVSYPFLLASKAGVGSTQSVACSGALLKDIIHSNYSEGLAQAKGKNDPAQNEDIAANYLVGYRPQVSFVEKNKPARLTISIGGNDIGFSKIILSCLAPDTCYSDPQERLNLVHTINAQYGPLVTTFERVKQAAATDAPIYALGYPSLADPKGNCALNVRLNSQEVELTNQISAYLNSVIKKAAAKAGLTYINVGTALAGYRLCETDSANIAVNGLTAGNDKTFSLPLGSKYALDGYFTGQESYHPNQRAHQMFSAVITAATNGFTLANPPAPVTVPDPANQDGGELLGAGTAALPPRKIIFEEGMADSVLIRGQTYPLQVNGLQPLSGASLQVHSSPILLDTYKSSESGQLNASFSLPASLPPGIHVLHLYAKNKAGEDLDIQKVIYVAAEAADIDGDGIPNEQEKCLLVEPANADNDQDGSDDGCDSIIGSPPQAATGLGSSSPNKANPIQQAGTIQQSGYQLPQSNLESSLTNRALAGDWPLVLGSATTNNAPFSVTSAVARGEGRSFPELSSKGSTGRFAVAALALFFATYLLYLALRKWRKRS